MGYRERRFARVGQRRFLKWETMLCAGTQIIRAAGYDLNPHSPDEAAILSALAAVLS
jgi:hypothetical protein